LEEELSQVLNGKTPSSQDIPNLKYLKAIIKETLRLYPSAPSRSRELTEDEEIMGYKLPKGSVIAFNTWIIHRNPKLWPNPETFDPERFTNQALDDQRHPLSWIPFGYGTRRCIGENLAILEATVVLATLFQKFHFQIDPSLKVETMLTLTMKAKHGLFVRPIAKKTSTI
jgi:cytochrome P450